MMNKVNKALCLALSLSCILGVSSITTTTAHAAKSQGKEVTGVNSSRSQLVTITGTLKVYHINYIVAPGPNDPLYSYSVITSSGSIYGFSSYGYAGDELAKHNGEEITIVGIVNSQSPSSIEVLSYKVISNR